MPQTASIEDMRIFEGFVGTFSSRSYQNDVNGSTYRFLVAFDWFDDSRTIIKYSIKNQNLSDSTTTVVGEGYYAMHPTEDHLFVVGVFNNGQRGIGSVGVIDHSGGYRETWVSGVTPDGNASHIRDTFRLLDEDSWENKTLMKIEPSEDWETVYEGIYTRVASP